MTDVFAWVTVGDVGNPPDPDPEHQLCGSGFDQPCGAVATAFAIGRFEVTNAEYAEFLNAVAATDTYALYNPSMGGITRSGISGSYSYAVSAGRGDMPVMSVSWYDAARFANWLHNGRPVGPQGSATTEDGAYTFTGPAAVGPRNPGARFFLPTENEWYKAAYFDPATSGWFDYPAGSDNQTTCSTPTAAPNHANCGSAIPGGDVTSRGSYSGSASPFGTFDQGGNVDEWTETDILGDGSQRGVRGGNLFDVPSALGAAARGSAGPAEEAGGLGFRVAPEPDGDLILLAGVVALAYLRARRLR
jgi:formylglycine-generating enzyme required for sulfatase activity